MRATASGAVDLLHTGAIGLADLETTFAELDSGTSTHAKVLVDPRR